MMDTTHTFIILQTMWDFFLLCIVSIIVAFVISAIIIQFQDDKD